MGFFQNQNFVALFHSGLQVFHEKKKGKEKVVCLGVPDLNIFFLMPIFGRSVRIVCEM